jgi:16S rRNA G966 N2-methylase RsmD
MTIDVSLLDWFAGQYLSGLAASRRGEELDFVEIAEESYRMARRMVEFSEAQRSGQ